MLPSSLLWPSQFSSDRSANKAVLTHGYRWHAKLGERPSVQKVRADQAEVNKA